MNASGTGSGSGRRQIEGRLLAEFAAQYYPSARLLTHVKLGGIAARIDTRGLSDSELMALTPWRRWADGVVIDPPFLRLIECKRVAQAQDVGQLEIYLALLPKTPELKEFLSLQVDPLLVTGSLDVTIADYARSKGIRAVQFQPNWMVEYLLELRFRARRGTPAPPP